MFAKGKIYSRKKVNTLDFVSVGFLWGRGQFCFVFSETNTNFVAVEKVQTGSVCLSSEVYGSLQCAGPKHAGVVSAGGVGPRGSGCSGL